MAVHHWFVISNRRLIILLTAILIVSFVAAAWLQGQACNKWTGVCRSQCGSRSSTDCGDFPNTCQWEVCSQYSGQLGQYPVLYSCYISGAGYPYTDTCVTSTCGLSYCPCAGVGPCGPF